MLPVRRGTRVQGAQREPGIGNYRHIIGLIIDNAIHPRQRDADLGRLAPDLGECAGCTHRRKRQPVSFTFADNLGYLLGIFRLDYQARGAGLILVWNTEVFRTNDAREHANQIQAT
jgi:hypothetical protein